MRYSEIFNIPSSEFDRIGVFDADTASDSHLHIDPSLFKGCSIPEFVGAYDEFKAFFTKIFILIPSAKSSRIAYKGLANKLLFKEIGNTCLGYSEAGTRGKGIGNKLACRIADSIISIYELGITNPVVFEMLPFFEEGIGADRISDMASFLLIGRLLDYTKRMCTELSIPTQPRIIYQGRLYSVPFHNGKSFVFVPKCILCDLPTASSWDDIDGVCSYNRAFRMRICEDIGGKISEVMKMSKREIKEYLFSSPDVFKAFVEDWERLTHKPYDFVLDKNGIMKKKTIFITYSWESEIHNQWVKKLSDDLAKWFDVRIDSRLPLGADLNVFMEQSITKADKVLLILTKEYKRRADSRLNGVGYETNVITDNYTSSQNTLKFIPIIREASKSEVYPIYLGNKLGLDMTDDQSYNSNLNTLIENLRK